MNHTNTPSASDLPVVSPSRHLLGILQNILQSRTDTTVLIPNKGKITIFPDRREYYANVLDMADFCRAPADQFRVQEAGEVTQQLSAQGKRNIKDLLWQAAFHISQGGMIEGCSIYQVVQFHHWPNLTRLPSTPNAARICALLTRHSYTVMLVHRILGVDKDEVNQIYCAAYAAGIARIIHDIGRKQNLTSEDEKDLILAGRQPESGFFRSLFSKISGL